MGKRIVKAGFNRRGFLANMLASATSTNNLHVSLIIGHRDCNANANTKFREGATIELGQHYIPVALVKILMRGGAAISRIRCRN